MPRAAHVALLGARGDSGQTLGCPVEPQEGQWGQQVAQQPGDMELELRALQQDKAAQPLASSFRAGETGREHL